MSRETNHDEGRDDVRAAPPSPTSGPNYRNLLVAVALLVALLGVSLFFLPSGPPAAEKRTAPDLPDRTFLDLPAPQFPAIPEPPPAKWFEDPDDRPPMPEDWAREWEREGDGGEPPEQEVEADPRQEAFQRALRSATLRASGLSAEEAAAVSEGDVLLQGAALLPSPSDLQASLQAAQNSLHRLEEGPAPSSGPGLSGGWELPGLASLPEGTGLPGGSGPPPSAGPLTGYHPPLRAQRYPPPTRKTLRAGTLIPARLETAIDSDSPGPVTARVLRDVTDSATGRRVLIPAGAQLLGSLDSQLAYGENRVLVAFERLTWPGATFELPGLDALGASGTRGLRGDVDRHFWPSLGRASLLALVGAGLQLSQPDQSTANGLSPEQVLAAQMGLEFGRVTNRILSRSLDRRPTVRIPAGERFYVFLNRDLRF